MAVPIGKGGKKTGGGLAIDITTMMRDVTEALNDVGEKLDKLGLKFDKMPSYAKKMANEYVASFKTIVSSIKTLSDQTGQLGGIADGLRNVADSTKQFTGTTKQGEAIASIADGMAKLGKAVKGFPSGKDVDASYKSFASGITALNKAFEGIKFPSDTKISQMNRSADAIRNIANALKSAGTVPTDVMANFAAATGGGHGGSGGSGGSGGETPHVIPDHRVPPMPETPSNALKDLFVKYAKPAATSAALATANAVGTSFLNEDASMGSLSQVLPMNETSSLNPFLNPFLTKKDINDRRYARGVKSATNMSAASTGLDLSKIYNLTEMQARYTANRPGDVRNMSIEELGRSQLSLAKNAREVNVKTGLEATEFGDMQLSLERVFGFKSGAMSTLKDSFVTLARSGSLTAKDLATVASGAKDAGMAFQISGDEAQSFVTKALTSATAVSNAGLKQSDVAGADAGFFGDKKAFLFDMMAGVTDEDYKDPEKLMQKQMALANSLTGGVENTMIGNQVLRGYGEAGLLPGFTGGDPRAFRKVQGAFGAVGDQRMALDAAQRSGAAADSAYLPWKEGIREKSTKSGAMLRLLTGIPMAITEKLRAASVDAPDHPTNPAGYNSGGLVAPGKSGSADTVPAMLTPGEEVLTRGDPRHRNNIDEFKRSFAQIEGYNAQGRTPNRPQRNLNPGNLRVAADWKNNPEKAMHIARKQGAVGYDAQGYLKFDSESAGFAGLERQMRIDAKRGMNVSSFIEKYAPASENNTAGYKAFIAKKGFAGDTPLSAILGGEKGASPSLAANGFSTSMASLTTTLSSALTGIVGMFSTQKAQSTTAQLDPAAMYKLTSIAEASSGSSDAIVDAISSLAQIIIQSNTNNSRSRSNNSMDLTASVARGNYAFNRG